MTSNFPLSEECIFPHLNVLSLCIKDITTLKSIFVPIVPIASIIRYCVGFLHKLMLRYLSNIDVCAAYNKQ